MEKLDNLINSFSIDNLKAFATDYFGINTQDNLTVNGYDNVTVIGTGTVDDFLEMGFFAVECDGIKEKPQKKDQYNIAKEILRKTDMAVGIFVFYKSKDEFRMSLVKCDYERTESGNAKPIFTNYKRYTYFVSLARTNNTFKGQIKKVKDTVSYDLENKGSVTSAGLQECFSLETVSDEFYKKIAYWYFWAYEKIQEKTGFPKDCDTKQKFEFMTSMITRIMFIWFLKEIGLVNEDLFDTDRLKDIVDMENYKDSYYKAILQNLFFATLSTPISEREYRDNTKTYNTKANQRGNQYLYRYSKYFKQDYQFEKNDKTKLKSLFEKTPFFNGGLFECKDIRDKNSKALLTVLDGFSDNDRKGKKNETDLFVPNEIFFAEEHKTDKLNKYFNIDDSGNQKKDIKYYEVTGLINILKEYNFTIDENTVSDQDISIDPEMLGKVFENLLGAQNPETSVKARNESGSFYTPREIVDYMCKESLKEYIITQTEKNINKDNVAGFEKYSQKEGIGEFEDLGKLGTVFDRSDDIIFNKELFSQDLDKLFNENEENPFNETASRKITDFLYNVKILDPACGSGAFPMGLLLIIVNCLNKLGDELSDYNKKLNIIQKCIYGVDIQKMAQEISFLRFYLSLLVDQKVNDNINDNYGIEPLPNLDFKIMQGNSLVETYKGIKLDNLFGEKDIEKFAENKEKYFSTKNKIEKAKLKENIYNYLYETLSANSNDPELKSMIWGNKDKTFFLFDTFFYEVFKEGGFDIVIGNPPYINAIMQEKTEALSKQRKLLKDSKDYKLLYQKWDLYIAFFEKGLNLLLKNGILSYIVPIAFTNQIYAKKVRENFLTENSLINLVDIDKNKVFNAEVFNCIPFVKKSNSQKYTWISQYDKENKTITKLYKKEYKDLIQNNETYIWNLSNESKETEKHNEMYKLGDICYISKGMVLNSDENDTINKFVKKDLISDTKDNIHSKHYIESKYYEKYKIKKIKYLEWNTYRCPSKVSRPTFEKLYNVDKLMLNGQGFIKGTIDIGEHYYCDQTVRIGVLWKDLKGVNNRSISNSITKFANYKRNELEKISENFSLKYLIGILNSKYSEILLNNIRGDNSNAIVPEQLKNIPIPKITKENKSIVSKIENLVDTITEKKNNNNDTTKEEAKIDSLVYQLYGLEEDEIAIIKGE